MQNLKRRLGVVLTAVVLALAGGVVLAAPAEAASGYASCSTSAIVGIWVDVDGGTDGFAVPNATSDPKVNTWSYNTQGKRWLWRIAKSLGPITGI